MTDKELSILYRMIRAEESDQLLALEILVSKFKAGEINGKLFSVFLGKSMFDLNYENEKYDFNKFIEIRDKHFKSREEHRAYSNQFVINMRKYDK